MPTTTLVASDPLTEWSNERKEIALQKVMANISPADGRPGAILASPSKKKPNYYYNWIRDAARTMRTLVALDSLPDYKKTLDGTLKPYVEFSKFNQSTPTPSNSLGEPKFLVSGEAFFGPWGRPQNDGPAERAIALVRWSKRLIKNSQKTYVATELYDGKEPSSSVIKADLDFVANHWQEPCFDLWEEVNGTHFYTRTQQRTALREGAALATVLKDPGAAKFYNEQAQAIEDDMERFWDPENNHIKTTLDYVGGLNYKYSNLDIAIILGSCYAYSKDFPFYSPNHDRVLASAFAIHNAFKDLYPINTITTGRDNSPMYPGIGRYQEDVYNPNGGKANPWFLCTAAISTLCYQAANLFSDQCSIVINDQNIGFLLLALELQDTPLTLDSGDKIEMTSACGRGILNGLRNLGDAYLRRVQYHGANDGSLSEQFDLNNGYMLSARDLTWSYISLIIAIDLREKLPLDDD